MQQQQQISNDAQCLSQTREQSHNTTDTALVYRGGAHHLDKRLVQI